MHNLSAITQADIPALLSELQREQFFGSLEIKLERGAIVLIRKTETIKPSNAVQQRSYRDNRAYDANEPSR